MLMKAPAKVNLYLLVTGKREDGYHELDTLFERISLFDEIELDISPAGDEILCDREDIPLGAESLTARTVNLFRRSSGVTDDFRISIRKRIPVGAGLGGGSSDVAAILSGLNRLTGGPLSAEELLCLGAELGADVPFFLHDVPFGFGKGIGDEIKEEKKGPEIWHVLVKPPFGISTARVYSCLPAFNLTRQGGVDRMFSAFLREKDIHGIAHNLRNDLQDIVLRDFPRLKGIFDILRRSGAKGELLSGSGSTVFGIFDREDIDAAANKVRSGLPRGEGWEVFVVNTY